MADEFARKHLQLLEIEREAEIEESRVLQENVSGKELQRMGVALVKLRISSIRNGLYGRTVINFEPFWPGKLLPAHRISSGDIVGVSLHYTEGARNTIVTGVVLSTYENSVSVACDASVDDLPDLADGVPYCILKLANDVAYKRIKTALDRICTSNCILTHVLFNKNVVSSPLTSIPPILRDEDGNLRFFDTSLDQSQKDAVTFALLQKEVAVIHGPPGTGKTTTVIEIIRQAVAQGLKVLACAPSNVAVDNLVERLANAKIPVIRLGHPARSLTSCHKFSLDAQIASSDSGFIIEDIRSDINKLGMKLKKCNSKGERQGMREELKNLYRDLKGREKAALKNVLKEASVILATLTTASVDGPLKHLHPQQFDLVVIDECSQAIEAACWIALLQCGKCILAGDHLQLPPTILSQKAAKEGLELTLMERVLQLHGDDVMRMLTTQYRMHEVIMRYCSDQLYRGKLVAHKLVASHLLKDMDGVKSSDDTDIPLLLIDTAGCSLHELDLDEMSKANEAEVCLTAMHVERLLQCGVFASDIAVISPYNLQVELLRHRLSNHPKLEIKSIDGFQGREKEAVVLSLVRSNCKGEVGFLVENRRINVAITRARRHLCVICDSETVSNDKFLQSLIEYMCSAGEVRSADQYKQLLNQETSQLFSSKLENLKLKSSKSGKNGNKSKTEKKKIQTAKTFNVEATKVAVQDSNVSLLETKINAFINSKSLFYEFSPTLSSQERRFVHEIAEKLKVQHKSEGEGQDRHIVLWKLGYKDDVIVGTCTESNKTHKVAVANQMQDPHPKTNVAIADKHMDTTAKTVASKKATIKYQKEEETGLKPKLKPGKQVVHLDKLKTTGQAEESFDEMVSSFKKIDNTCFFSKCKVSMVLISQTCPYCDHRFCLGHHLPEIHGCGEAARRHARGQMKQQLSGNFPQPPKVTAVKHAQLERKLEKKLSDMSHHRQRKQKPDKTK